MEKIFPDQRHYVNANHFHTLWFWRTLFRWVYSIGKPTAILQCSWGNQYWVPKKHVRNIEEWNYQPNRPRYTVQTTVHHRRTKSSLSLSSSSMSPPRSEASPPPSSPSSSSSSSSRSVLEVLPLASVAGVAVVVSAAALVGSVAVDFFT